MKKFAAFAAALLLLVPVFCFSGSAKLFSDDSILEYRVSVSSLSWDPAQAFSAFYIVVLDTDGNAVYTWSGEESLFVRNALNADGLAEPFLRFVENGSLTGEGLYSSDPILSSYTLVYRCSSPSSLGTVETVSVPGAVSSLSSSVFGLGSSLLAFVQSSWITLLALGAFLVILCIGFIRRLVKGV